jgi:hypothetical protein
MGEKEGESEKKGRGRIIFSKAHCLVNARKGHGQFVQTKSFEMGKREKEKVSEKGRGREKREGEGGRGRERKEDIS